MPKYNEYSNQAEVKLIEFFDTLLVHLEEKQKATYRKGNVELTLNCETYHDQIDSGTPLRNYKLNVTINQGGGLFNIYSKDCSSMNELQEELYNLKMLVLLFN